MCALWISLCVSRRLFPGRFLAHIRLERLKPKRIKRTKKETTTTSKLMFNFGTSVELGAYEKKRDPFNLSSTFVCSAQTKCPSFICLCAVCTYLWWIFLFIYFFIFLDWDLGCIEKIKLLCIWVNVHCVRCHCCIPRTFRLAIAITNCLCTCSSILQHPFWTSQENAKNKSVQR